MQIKTSRPDAPLKFNPITVTLTIESQEEADALFQVGNYSSPIAEKLAKDTAPAGRRSPALKDVTERVLFAFYQQLESFVRG